MATERGLIEAKLRQHDGQALGDPGHTVQHIAEQIAAAVRESRKADVEFLGFMLRHATFDPRATNYTREEALAALSRLSGDE
jgi:hypothetical protein